MKLIRFSQLLKMKPVVFASGDVSKFYKFGGTLLGYSVVQSEECDHFQAVVIHKFVESDTLYLSVIHSMAQDRVYWEEIEDSMVILVDSEPLRRFYGTLFPSKQVHCIQDIFDDIRELPEENFCGLGDADIQQHCMEMATKIGSNFFSNSFYFVCLLEYDHQERMSRNVSFQKEQFRKSCCKCSILKRRKVISNLDDDRDSGDEIEASFRNAIGIWHATRISNVIACLDSALGQNQLTEFNLSEIDLTSCTPTNGDEEDGRRVQGTDKDNLKQDGIVDDGEVPGSSKTSYRAMY